MQNEEWWLMFVLAVGVAFDVVDLKRLVTHIHLPTRGYRSHKGIQTQSTHSKWIGVPMKVMLDCPVIGCGDA